MNPYTLALSLALLTPAGLAAAEAQDTRYLKDVQSPYVYSQATLTYSLKCDASGFDGHPRSYDAANYCLAYKIAQADMIEAEYTEAVNKHHRDRPEFLKQFHQEQEAWSHYTQTVAAGIEQRSADASGPGLLVALNYKALTLQKKRIHDIWLLWLAPQVMPEPIIQEIPH